MVMTSSLNLMGIDSRPGNLSAQLSSEQTVIMQKVKLINDEIQEKKDGTLKKKELSDKMNKIEDITLDLSTNDGKATKRLREEDGMVR
jgi:hypothetical protein